MGVERCTRCDTHIDLDYNTNGAYLEDGKETDFVCEHCLTDEEIDKLDGKDAGYSSYGLQDLDKI